MSHHAIGDHALLSDLHSAALVDRDGTIGWWCLPRFDSPSVFARLLDEEAGHFRVGPPSADAVERSYDEDAMVLRTRFRTATGTLELTDALALGRGERGHETGAHPPHTILRRARCLDGEVELEIDFAPRFEYGLTTPIVREVDHGVVATGGPTTLRLSASIDIHADTTHASARTTLREGEGVELAVQGVYTWEPLPEPWSSQDVERRLDDTTEAWRSWAAQHQRYEGPYAEAVRVSGRVLRALTFQETGALVAAPTTSLPERVGGSRNWDYRYAWVRDASLTLHALWVSACPDEAADFLDYLTNAATSVYGRTHMQIMFGVRGERDLSERELPWLSGWRGSRPVRVGNAAWTQTQTDIYGELLDAVHRLRDVIGDFSDLQRRLLTTLADRAAEGWRETDHGIWEIRAEPRHYVHSKLMSWLALDRALDLAPDIGAEDHVEAWSEAREEIRDAIERDGWNHARGAFTQFFGSDELDASVLLIPIVGFLPADDERVLSTIDAVAGELGDARGLVRRYSTEDGLDGTEGAFLLCTFWLAEAEARAGRLDQACARFEHAAGHANDVGLLAEEVDPSSGELLGNFPQALSHIGLVNAAWAIAEAMEG